MSFSRNDLRNFLQGRMSDPDTEQIDKLLQEVAKDMLNDGYTGEEFLTVLAEKARHALKIARDKR